MGWIMIASFRCKDTEALSRRRRSARFGAIEQVALRNGDAHDVEIVDYH